MFMTSLEVEAQNKGLKGLEFQLKLEELERMKAEHQKEVQALEEERNGLEKEVAADSDKQIHPLFTNISKKTGEGVSPQDR